MNHDVDRARRQVLDALAGLSDRTDEIDSAPGTEWVMIAKARDSLREVHKALYGLHTRLDRLERQ